MYYDEKTNSFHTVLTLKNLSAYLTGFFTIVLLFKSIPHTPNCFDILRIRSIKFNLLTNLFNMNGNGRNVTDRIHIPDFTEEFFFRIYMIRIFSKGCKKVKFLCGKLFFLSVNPYSSCGLVNLNPANFNDIIFYGITSDKTFIT